MGNVLSHSEVEAVLSALDYSSSPTPSKPPAHSALATPLTPEASANVPAVPHDLYDFEHPLPLKPTQMDALRLASAAASRTIQAGLSRLLRTSVTVNFLGVEQSTFRDYLAASESPTCLAAFGSVLSNGLWLVEISRSLSFTMIDFLLGGQPTSAGPILTRPFTDVETRLISKPLATVFKGLSGDVLPTQSLEMSQVVSDGALLVEAASNEAVALISFEITCGPSQGLMQLCVPWKEISKTSALSQVSASRTGERLRLAASKVPVVVTVQVARLKISAREVDALSPGDVLVTDVDTTAEMGLEIDHREIFRGTPAQSHDRKVFLVSRAVPARSSEMINEPRSETP